MVYVEDTCLVTYPPGITGKFFTATVFVPGKVGEALPKLPAVGRKTLNRPKGNECSQYKSTGAIFSSSLPIWQVYFRIVMLRHVWMGQMGRLEENKSQQYFLY